MKLGDAQENSFTAFKVAIPTALVLRLPDFEHQFIITTDISDVAIRAILEQDFGSGLQPMAFSSQKLNSTKIRYMNGSYWASCGPLVNGNIISRAQTP